VASNPFDAFAVIEYELPEAASINLAIFNHLGQQVEVLVNQHQDAVNIFGIELFNYLKKLFNKNSN